jgi:hypothetical protein
MVDPVRNKQHGNGDRNDDKVAKADLRRHEERARLEQERKEREAKGAPPRR